MSRLDDQILRAVEVHMEHEDRLPFGNGHLTDLNAGDICYGIERASGKNADPEPEFRGTRAVVGAGVLSGD